MKIHYVDGYEFYIEIYDAKTTERMQKIIASCANIDVNIGSY